MELHRRAHTSRHADVNLDYFFAGPYAITAGQMSYDLRRLRTHGLITRIPRSHRYRLTEIGLHHAMLLSHIQTRLLLPGLAQLTDPDPPASTALRAAATAYQRALNHSCFADFFDQVPAAA